jgi:predicted secreted protein
VAIEDELNRATLNFDVPETEITSFADVYQNFLAGKPGLTVDVDGSWDPASSQGDVTIFGDLGGAAQTYDFEPDGTTGYNGYGIITSYSITSSRDDVISYTMSLRHNGGSAAADGAAPTRA